MQKLAARYSLALSEFLLYFNRMVINLRRNVASFVRNEHPIIQQTPIIIFFGLLEKLLVAILVSLCFSKGRGESKNR